ncbi:MAG: YbaB/EbfC family nucleoid-associated protein, partial [Patescibacteria group bacterium]
KNMFEKAKELYKLQKQAREIKGKLKNTHIEAEDSNVTVIINGEQTVVKVEFKDGTIPNKKHLEESTVKELNKAIKRSQQIGAETMKGVMGDSFPGLS